MNKNTYYYCDGLFYPPDIKYDEIPQNAVEISIEEYTKAANRSPYQSFNVNDLGVVSITHPEPPSKEQLKKNAEIKKKGILDGIINATSIMRAELQLGLITEQRKEKLIHYISLYNEVDSIDTNIPPDEWPEVE